MSSPSGHLFHLVSPETRITWSLGIPAGAEEHYVYTYAGLPIASVREVLDSPDVIFHEGTVGIMEHYDIKRRLLLIQVSHYELVEANMDFDMYVINSNLLD
jgi:hypothetical protein